MDTFTIRERLDRSTRKNIHVDPVPDETPNGLSSDCLVTFVDRNNVIDDCRSSPQDLEDVKKWVEDQLMAILPDKIANEQRFARRLRKQFSTSGNPKGGFNPRYVTVDLLCYKTSPTQQKQTLAKFWFAIRAP